MSVRANPERAILLNVTNMEDRGGDIKLEETPSEVRETKTVKADPTPPANKPNQTLPTPMDALSHGDPAHCRYRPGNPPARKDCLRSLHGRSGKLGSGSGSGEPELGNPEDCSGDPAAKKRKTRRGKPKHRKPKPYSKQQRMSYGPRQRCRGLGRLTKTGGQPPAPYNTTQFLMEDHSDLPDLEQKLADVITSEVPASFQKPLAPPRTRDSSFSVDSDEDYFYSSPEDEEEFLTKEFSSAYEDLHAERLGAMTKSELIQEYVQLEAKLDLMTKRLRAKGLQSEEREAEGKNCASAATATVAANTSSTTDSEIAKKLKICQQRIDDLLQQNEQLRRDNETLRSKSCASPVSSVDSESDSESSSNGNRSSCSCSGKSAASPPTGKKNRRDANEQQRRCKRHSSVDSESDSNSSCCSDDDSAKDDTNNLLKNSPSRQIPNGNAAGHEFPGLPT